MPAIRKQRQMVNMTVLETSGVDHPAHGYEGWLVRKSADPQSVAKLRGLVRKDNVMPQNVMTKAQLIEDVRKSKAPASAQEALVKAIDLTDDVNAAAELWKSLRDKLEADNPDVPSTMGQGAPSTPAPAPAPAPSPAGGIQAAPAAAGADLFKSVTDPAAREALTKMAADNEALRKSAEAAMAKAARLETEALDKAAVEASKASFAHLAIDHEKVAPALRKMAVTDPDAYALVRESLEKAEGQLDAADMFGEIGTAAAASGSTAMAKATKIAEGYVAAGVSPTMDAAMAKAWSDNPSLYTEYESEGAR